MHLKVLIQPSICTKQMIKDLIQIVSKYNSGIYHAIAIAVVHTKCTS